jgi:Leucine-rich repeat (LRR) protein
MQRRDSQTDSNISPAKAQKGIVLTQEFLVMKTRQPLPQIVKLNLWGNDLCDVSFLKNLANLEVLALTVNQLSTLQDFSSCFKIKELYLRRNNIPASLTQIHYLSGLNSLRILNLSENPIATELPHYRLMVLKYLPKLEKLDDVVVSY